MYTEFQEVKHDTCRDNRDDLSPKPWDQGSWYCWEGPFWRLFWRFVVVIGFDNPKRFQKETCWAQDEAPSHAQGDTTLDFVVHNLHFSDTVARVFS